MRARSYVPPEGGAERSPQKRHDAAPASGAGARWVFKQGRELYGPVPTEVLEAKLRSGELGPDTLVAREQGPFAPIGAVEPFVALAAEMAAEVARKRAEEERRKKRGLLLGGALLVFLGMGAATWFLALAREAPLRHRELQAITIEALPMVVRAVEAPPDGEEDEWELPPAPAAPRRVAASAPPAPAKTAPSAPAAARDPNALAIETHYDGAAIERVVARNRGRLLGCIRTQAESDATFRGELPLSFVVGNDGRVARLWVDRVGYRSGPLHDCLLAELRKWEFPRFEGQRPAISLRFRVGG